MQRLTMTFMFDAAMAPSMRLLMNLALRVEDSRNQCSSTWRWPLAGALPQRVTGCLRERLVAAVPFV